MVKFNLLISTFVLLKSYSCWVMTDINPKMLNENILDDLDNLEVEEMRNGKSLIFPGTKWCGAGNKSTNYDDLGSAREADMCCREHDHCPDVIPGGETKYNLTNPSFYSRLSCACDDKFYNCLKAAGTTTASIVGALYFNGLETQCFREEYPAKCAKWTFLHRRCLEYSYDKNGNKMNQWFDLKKY